MTNHKSHSDRETMAPAPNDELAAFEAECRRADKSDWFVTLSGLVLQQIPTPKQLSD